MHKDPTEFRERFKRWKTGEKVYEAGLTLPEPVITPDTLYNEFLNTLPDNQRLTPNYQYDTRRYWELNGKPKNFDEAVQKNMYKLKKDGWHGNSIQWKENGDAEFMKPKTHSTVAYETGWYDRLPEDSKFKQDYELTDDPNRPNFYMYKKRILPAYDMGSEDNPWIPKGTKLETNNSEPKSAKPTTTAVSKNTPSILEASSKDIKREHKKNIMLTDALDDMQSSALTEVLSFVTSPFISKIMLPILQQSVVEHFSKNRERLITGAQASVMGDTPNLWHFLTGVPVEKGEEFKGVFRTKDGDVRTSSDRDLTRLAILGEDNAFIKYPGQPLVVNGKSYDYANQYYGQIFPYSNLPVPEKVYQLLEQYSKTKRLLLMPDNIYYGTGDGTFDVSDNVARHGAAIKQREGLLYYHPYDVWDFAGNYKYSYIPYMNSLFLSAITPNETFPNSGTFVLRLDVPIVVDNEAYKTAAFKGFVRAVRNSENKDELLYDVIKDYMTINANGIPLNDPDERVNFEIDYDKGKSIKPKK